VFSIHQLGKKINELKKKIENKELSKARDSCLILSSQKERNEKTKKAD
jgi:hypothetical protein